MWEVLFKLVFVDPWLFVHLMKKRLNDHHHFSVVKLLGFGYGQNEGDLNVVLNVPCAHIP